MIFFLNKCICFNKTLKLKNKVEKSIYYNPRMHNQIKIKDHLYKGLYDRYFAQLGCNSCHVCIQWLRNTIFATSSFFVCMDWESVFVSFKNVSKFSDWYRHMSTTQIL